MTERLFWWGLLVTCLVGLVSSLSRSVGQHIARKEDEDDDDD